MDKYSFGEFELDLAGMRLCRHGEPVHLERRPLDLLILLVREPGCLLTREALIAGLWPSNVVIDFETGLNTLVRKVRQALGDSADAPRYIETVAGRGYRFIADVRTVGDVEASATLTTSDARRVSRRPGHAVGIAFVLVLALITVVGFMYAAGTPRVQRIAVLPLENVSGDASLGYLANGIAEETSVSLSRMDPQRLRVIGGVSTQSLAGSPLPVRDLGRQLGADYLVLSSLRAEPPTIRIAARLVRVADNEQIWAESFDFEATDLLALESELSAAIAEQIRLQLSPEFAAAIARRQTANPQAYELYLKGRHDWRRFLPSANQQALRYYESAVELDPHYALAWAGIAHLLATSTVSTDVAAADVDAKARHALERAMSLDPELAEVQYAKGYIDFFLDWDLAAAETAARRAVELDPNSAIAQMLLGVLASELGNHAEAIVAMRRARELDPLFAQTSALSAMVAWHAGDATAALRHARRAVTIDPDAWVGRLHLGNAYLLIDDFDAAEAAFAVAERLSGGNSVAVSSRAYALARLGRTAEARRILDEFSARAVHETVPASAIARIHAGLGEIDAAFDWLDLALDSGDVHASSLVYELTLLPLRDDARFTRLVRGCPRNCRPASGA